MDSIALWNTESKRFKWCDGILKILQQFWGTTVLGSYQWITKNHFPKFDKYNKVKYKLYFTLILFFYFLWLILCYLVLYFSLNHVKLIYTRKKLLFYFLLKINEKKKLKMLFFILNCKSWYIFVWFNSEENFIWYSQVKALKYNLADH